MGENLIDNSDSRITKSGMPLINRKSFTKKCDRRFAKLLKRVERIEDIFTLAAEKDNTRE